MVLVRLIGGIGVPKGLRWDEEVFLGEEQTCCWSEDAEEGTPGMKGLCSIHWVIFVWIDVMPLGLGFR